MASQSQYVSAHIHMFALWLPVISRSLLNHQRSPIETCGILLDLIGTALALQGELLNTAPQPKHRQYFSESFFPNITRVEIAAAETLATFSSKVVMLPLSEDEILAETESRMKPYFQLVDRYPHILGPGGVAQQIQIIRDIQEIVALEKRLGVKVGIAAQNKFHTMLVDPVRFSNGTTGTYDRYLVNTALNAEDNRGAVALTKTTDGRYVFVSQFRHATRRVCVENIRGCGDSVEAVTHTLMRELKEEGGGTISGVPKLLGKVDPDSGLTTGGISIYQIVIDSEKSCSKPDRDDVETNIQIHLLTQKQVLEAVLQGYILGEKGDQIPLQDSFTLASLVLEHAHVVSGIKS